jgi:hypothetical protein
MTMIGTEREGRGAAASRWLALALALVALAAGGTVRADDAALARAHFTRGKQHYAAGKFQEAIRSFRQAAAIQGSPTLEYNIGRCHEKLGQPDAAIAAYQRYLQGKPDASNRAEVQAKIAELRRLIAAGVPKDPYEDLEKPSSAPAPRTAPASRAPAEEPGAPGAAPQVPPRDGREQQADPPHEASLPQSWRPAARPAPAAPRLAQAAPRSPAPSPRPAPPPSRRDEGPVYKQWWFWVAIAGGAVVAGFVIGVAATGSSSPSARSSGLEVRF